MRDCRALRAQLLAGAEPRWLKTHKRRRYVTSVALSIPTWVDWDHIKRIHAWKRLLSVATGVEHVVDHIVPLNHPYVCGLTVPWNLQVTTRLQNGAKGNTFSPDQLELDLRNNLNQHCKTNSTVGKCSSVDTGVTIPAAQ